MRKRQTEVPLLMHCSILRFIDLGNDLLIHSVLSSFVPPALGLAEWCGVGICILPGSVGKSFDLLSIVSFYTALILQGLGLGPLGREGGGTASDSRIPELSFFASCVVPPADDRLKFWHWFSLLVASLSVLNLKGT